MTELAAKLLSAVVTGYTIYLLAEIGWSVSLRLGHENRPEEEPRKVLFSRWIVKN